MVDEAIVLLDHVLEGACAALGGLGRRGARERLRQSLRIVRLAGRHWYGVGEPKKMKSHSRIKTEADHEVLVLQLNRTAATFHDVLALLVLYLLYSPREVFAEVTQRDPAVRRLPLGLLEA